MDYQEMWAKLKQKLISDAEYHKSGVMQSISESIHGESKCKEILEFMTQIEEDERKKK